MIPVFKPYIDKKEEEAVIKVLRSRWLGKGKIADKFENDFKKYTGAKYATSTTSATSALHLAIKLSGIKKGDEVITTPITFIATNQAILMFGATPVFADVNYKTLNIDPEDIERKITKSTKAIMIMHFGGHPCDMDKILKICSKYKLQLIEDSAHGMGSLYKSKHVGTFGDFGCFSFSAAKNVTTGDGGMLVTKKEKDINLARAMSWSGISKNTWERAKTGKYKWKYNVIDTGWKFQMNDIAASIGRVQLKKLKKSNKLRENIFSRYNKEFENTSWIETPVHLKNVISSNHNYTIKVPTKDRGKLNIYLAEREISTSVHYVPNHLYKLYKKFKVSLPVADMVWKKILLLPIYPDLTIKEQDYIIKTIKKYKA